MYDLKNIFEVFLPQLLLYPNPTDPLNGEAANLLLKDPEKYKEKVIFMNNFRLKNMSKSLQVKRQLLIIVILKMSKMRRKHQLQVNFLMLL